MKNKKLSAIKDFASEALNTQDLEACKGLLRKIIGIIDPALPTSSISGQIIISCDASIKVNPGGPSAVGVVILHPDGPQVSFARVTDAVTNNQAEYDAVYFGLLSLLEQGRITYPTEVRSDSQLVIRQLNDEIVCKKTDLQDRRDRIWSLVKGSKQAISFTWRPRNSTAELQTANFMAQDALGVPRH